MKKNALFLLLLPFLFLSCSDNDDDKQDYTSFVVYHTEPTILTNAIAGYFTNDGLCKKLGELGNLTQDVYSEEIVVENDTLRNVYVFADNKRLDTVFILKPNKTNIFYLTKGTKGIRIDITDNTQYPID